ncbi:MAG: dephospho-CoA kinase [Anaerolineae bacterium]|nr:dephospho-CoA kinase [Anaerolineae bacterium]
MTAKRARCGGWTVGRWQNKYVIGLTGNIAMGKSLVLQMLQHLGAYTIDADGLAHQVMAPNAPAYKPVIEMFGRFVVNPQGQIDRNRLGAVVFSHPEALQALEAMTHPIISAAIDTLISRAKHQVVVVEAIKLLEGKLADGVDAIWVVDSSAEKQLERLITKRKLPREEALKRINVQNPQGEKLARADVVIRNDGKPEETWAQVQRAWQNIAQSKRDDEQAQAVTTVKSWRLPPAAPRGTHPAPRSRCAPTRFRRD